MGEKKTQVLESVGMHEGQLRTGDAQELGGLQPYELTLDKFIAHAAKWHPQGQVVTGGGAGGTVARVDYPALRERANLLSGAFAALGIAPGNRIATLAWNSTSHMEAWYAAFGMGVSCHTLNPRLGVAQLADMIRQADDRLLAISPDQGAVAEQLVRECPSIAHILVLEEPGSDFPLPVASVPVWTLQRLVAEHGTAH